MTTITQEQYQALFMQICNLKADLTSNASPIGDWKVIKCVEAQLAGETAPYDIETLREQRQAVREQINELEEQYANAVVEQPETQTANE